VAEFEEMMRTIGLVGAGVFAVLFAVRAWWAWRTRAGRTLLTGHPPLVAALQAVSIIALALIGYGLTMYLFVVQRGTVFMPGTLQAAFAVAVLAYIALELGLAFWPRQRNIWLRGLGALAMAAAGGLGFLLTANALNAFAYPPPADSAILARLPFEGEWAAVGAGASGLTNHHDRIASQKYAADMAAVCEDGRLFRGAGVTNEESCTFGATIVSPVDGVVVHVLDGLEDGASREVLPGNHVVIRFGENLYVALAHFRQNTIRVRVGEAVTAGQPIAEAGNSGNSDLPHLHIHVQDTPEYQMEASRALPYRFAEMERRRYLWWSRVRDGFLLSNDRVRPVGGD